MEDHVVEGITVCGGVVIGNAKIVNNMGEIMSVCSNDIIIVPNNNPLFAVGVLKAAGLICQEGGIISHICTVAMEMGIPSITQAHNAIINIANNTKIKLDANEGKVYIIPN